MEPVVITLLLMVLVGAFGIKQYVKERKIKNGKLALALAYEQMVMKHRLQIEHVEVFDNRIIALDCKHKKLLFLHHHAADHQQELILLPEIATLQLIEEREKGQGFIKKVYLALAPAEMNKTYLLCFYDHTKDAPMLLLPAMRRARNWKQRVDANRSPGMVNLEAELVI